VKAGVPVTMEGRSPSADTQVTAEIFLYACFSG